MIILGQVSKREVLEDKFETSLPDKLYEIPRWNIQPESENLIISSDNLHTFTKSTYGLVPFWSKRRVLFYQAPVEGDAPLPAEYAKLRKRIIQHPVFRKPIREKRCLIPVDYFILYENGIAYLFYLTTGRPFALAGIHDEWKEHIADPELYHGHSVITLPACQPYSKLSFTRIPLILPEQKYKAWLNRKTSLTDLTALMDYYPDKHLNGYQISIKAIRLRTNAREITQSIGNTIKETSTFDMNKVFKDLKSFRFTRGISSDLSNEELTWNESQKR